MAEDPLDGLSRDARRERAEAGRWARVNQVLYYAIGITATIAGFVAAISASAGWLKAATAIAGFVAGLLAGITHFWERRRRPTALGKRPVS